MKCHSYNNFFINFANKSKLDIILLLMNGSMNVTSIVEKTGQEQSAVSHNLKNLCDCNILVAEKKGREKIYSLNKDTVIPVLKLVAGHVKKHCKEGCCKK